jgi:3-dehydrocarnitine:acetyl-CoA trimethylamine transferase
LSCGRGGTFAFDAATRAERARFDPPHRGRSRGAYRSLRPDLCSLDVGSLNFDKLVDMNAPSELREMRRIRAAGTKPELEVFDLGGHIEFGKQSVQEGLIETPALFQIVLGVRWGAPATFQAMAAMKDVPRWGIS